MGSFISVYIDTEITSEEHEKLEDKIRDLLENEGITGTIENDYTGNSTCTRPEKTKRR
jgi:hypothetical protein